jgi:hypothetical protein
LETTWKIIFVLGFFCGNDNAEIDLESHKSCIVSFVIKNL